MNPQKIKARHRVKGRKTSKRLYKKKKLVRGRSPR